MYKPLLKRAPLPSHPVIAELGIGEGAQTIRMVRTHDGRGFGVDRNPTALALTRKAWLAATAHDTDAVARLDLVRAELLELPVRGFNADLVHSEGVLEHFSAADQRRFMALHRDLSRRWVIIFTPRPSPLYTSVRRILTSMDRWLYPDEQPMDVAMITRLGRECGLEPIASTVHLWENGVLFAVR